ncbi:MAG TPA: Fe-S cluster assembly protein SufD [Candidatus Didemnitutus sp.]|nr:Fe-S cluster assembly protein SufD [Candidatus Didemnitutus sp.]
MSVATDLPATVTGSFTREAFEAHLARVRHLPAWWLERKRAAYERFVSLPLPVRTDESWRFSQIAGLVLDDYRVPSSAVDFKQTTHADLGVPGAGTLLFANNRLAMQEPLATAANEQGMIFDTLQNALLKHGDLVRAHLLTQPSRLGSAKFAALHEAFLEDGAFIHVPRNVEVALPVGVFHYGAGAGVALFPHTLIVAEENARITVADFHRSTRPHDRQFVCGGNDIYVGHGAQVTYVAMQDWSRETLALQFNATVVRRDARVLSINLHAGARQARHESFSQLQAPGAHSEMLALTVARGSQEFDQRTLQIHQAPNTSSNLLYKNALLETARTIFSGLIIVDPDAQKTDAYQSNRNLMLSDDAEAHSLPGLEIQANDVRCTHGATSARIPPEQEFYLQSRGIRKAQADELIVFGFFEEILGRIANSGLHDRLTEIIRRKLSDS